MLHPVQDKTKRKKIKKEAIMKKQTIITFLVLQILCIIPIAHATQTNLLIRNNVEDFIKDGVLDLKDVIGIMKQLAEPTTDPNNLMRINMSRLLSVKNHQEYQTKLKEWMIAYMIRIVDQNLEKALEYECSDFFYKYYWDGIALDTITDAPGGLEYYPEANINEGAEEFSETNNQVTGVDEADFIKNDGLNIYMLVDSKFIIIDAWPPEEAHIISEYNIQGTPKKLFVHNGRAVIYSALEKINDNPFYGSNNECTHGYDCQFTGDGNKLKLTILDISNVSQPDILRELYFDGAYINSRRIDQSVYTIILFPEPIVEGVVYDPDLTYCNYPYDWEWVYPDWEVEKRYTDEELVEIFENLKERNRQIIMESDISTVQPKVRDVRYVDGQPVEQERVISDIDDIHFSSQQDGSQFLSIFVFDINVLSSQQAVSVIGKPGAVYASSSACYVATRHYTYNMPWFSYGWGTSDEMTTIHKFELKQSPATSVYAGSGVVKGRVLNQFAMDEHNGFFRVATTTGYLPNPETHSTLSVLKPQTSGDLETVGTIENIAPTEDIRSVRFNGDQGFIVTFKKTDPLFVLDLSNPENPKITGELHIPGFSTYMHLMDTNHLLSIGYDSYEQGSFAWFQGILLQVFDISDMGNPKLIHKEVIGTRGTTSEAATNHLAFNYFMPKNLLAIPMAICEGGSGGTYGDTMTFNGLMVYKTTVSNGFEYLGGVDHEISGNCYNWWTDSDSAVKRSIFMDDYVFSVSDTDIRVDLITEIGKHVAVIELSDK